MEMFKRSHISLAYYDNIATQIKMNLAHIYQSSTAPEDPPILAA